MPEVGSGLRVEDTSLVRVWEQRLGLVCQDASFTFARICAAGSGVPNTSLRVFSGTTGSWSHNCTSLQRPQRVLHCCTAACQAAAMADVPPPQQPKKRPKKPPPATERADLATLYCLQATARCALDGCAVCAHRICQHGAPGRPLPPAQRPESLSLIHI